jgi:drug/metabolite transporter (DMT)-like permease
LELVEGEIINSARPERWTWIAFGISTLLGGNNAIAVRFSNAELPPFFGAGVRFAAAALLLFLIVLALRLPATWIAVLYLVLLGSVATFVLALYVMARWTATASSYQRVLMPIVTVFFASLLAGETVTAALLVGGLLALAGVYVGAIAPPDLLKRMLSRQRAAQS